MVGVVGSNPIAPTILYNGIPPLGRIWLDSRSYMSEKPKVTKSMDIFRSSVIYLFTLVLFTGLFIAFHYLANQVPQQFVVDKLARDFHYHNLSKHNYPFSVHGSHSIVSNIGQNQFTECAVLLGVLATPSDKLIDAVLPPRLFKTGRKSGCETLKETVTELSNGGQTDAKTQPIRTRYWWGARAVYSFALRYLNVYQTREMIRNVTSLAYLGLAVALMSIASSVFWVLSPLLLFGVLFSGISYFSEVVLGVPYLWAIVAPALVAALHASKVPKSVIYLTVFIAGMVSAYLWLLDGHILLLVSWLLLIGYFSAVQGSNAVQSAYHSILHTVIYGVGFISSYLSGQLAKAIYVGTEAVTQSVLSAMANRSSSVGPGEVELNAAIVMDKVWNIGYQWTGVLRHELLWKVVMVGSIGAAIIGTVLCVIRALKGDLRTALATAVCFLVVITVFARLFLLQNHAVIHAFFIGRYMFIPLAMGWTVLLIGLTPWFNERSRNQ